MQELLETVCFDTKTNAQATQFAMGTVMAHKAFGMNAEVCLQAVVREIDWIERHLSRFLPQSDVWRVNENAGKEMVPVSSALIEILSRSMELSRICQGAFDVTIAPLVETWRIGQSIFSQPEDIAIEKSQQLVSYQDILLDPAHSKAGLKRSGQKIDLGAIGKGYTGDKIIELFKEFGVISAYSNLGGNVVTLGARPDEELWRIGIQHPREEKKLIGFVSVSGKSVVTSGDYQRFSHDGKGKRFHHILDPRSGLPADSGVISATVVCKSSMTADALSTAFLILGVEQSIEILHDLFDVDFVLMDQEECVFVTRGLVDVFHPGEDVNFKII